MRERAQKQPQRQAFFAERETGRSRRSRTARATARAEIVPNDKMRRKPRRSVVGRNVRISRVLRRRSRRKRLEAAPRDRGTARCLRVAGAELVRFGQRLAVDLAAGKRNSSGCSCDAIGSSRQTSKYGANAR